MLSYKQLMLVKKEDNMKKLGLGSLSLPLAIFGIIFSFDFGPRLTSLGDIILKFFNIPQRSPNNFHYSVIISFLLIVSSIFIGNKYPDHLGAITMQKARIWFISIFILAMLLLVVQ